MLFLASPAFAVDIALRVELPDLPPYSAVLCGVSEEGTTSARLQVPTPGLFAWQFHVYARPGEREGDLLVSVPFGAVDLRTRPSGDSDSEWHTITPVTVPAFFLAVGGSGTVTYPVETEGLPYPQIQIPGQKALIVPRFTLAVTRLAPGTAGCAS